MKRWGLLGGLLISALVLMTGGQAAAQTPSNRVVVVTLTGTVDPLSARYVERGIRIAGDEHAAGVLIRIDTPGGLGSSMEAIVQAIGKSSVPVVCWTGPTGTRAASAGSIIMLGCPIAAMAPGTNIGAAHPVGFSGQVLDEKVTNDSAAYAISLAQLHHRNPTIAEQMVRQSISLSSQDALRQRVIDLIAPTARQLFQDIGGHPVNGVTVSTSSPAFQPVGMTVIESILHGIIDPDIIYLLFLLGLVGIIFEILHPGIRLPGVLGVFSFIVSLVLLDLLPVNIAGVVLLIIGMALLAFEVHIHTVGVAATLGVASLILGGLFLFQSSVPNAAVSKWLIVLTALTLAVFFTLVVRAVVQSRREPPLRTGTEQLVGAEAIVVRPLDPAGVVRVHREQWSARTGGAPIPEGARVRITRVQGLTLEVEQLESSQVSQREGESR